MISRKLLLLTLLSALSSLSVVTVEGRKKVCPDEKTCTDLNSQCRCYCSRICGLRKKEADDKPVYVKDDPAGYYCYCKQWDYDNFQKNCALKDKNKKNRLKHRAQMYAE